MRLLAIRGGQGDQVLLRIDVSAGDEAAEQRRQ